MDDRRLPLSSLLSQLLVAFTIEFDNEFEHQMPHRTAENASNTDPDAPWLVSMVMWSNFIQYVPEKGVLASELRRHWRMDRKTLVMWLTRLSKRGRYLRVQRVDGSKANASDAMVSLTTAGRKARRIWHPLAAMIEHRWQERFGKNGIKDVRSSLEPMVQQFEIELPDYVPILGYGLFSKGPEPPVVRSGAQSKLGLAALLSKALLMFAIEFEHDSQVSLAISANILRLAGDGPAAVRELPRQAGTSKEAVATALSFLEKQGYAVRKTSTPRNKLLTLTPKGQHAYEIYTRLMQEIEERWRKSFGKDAVARLRKSLEQIIFDQRDLLLFGLKPYPDGWRAGRPPLESLPHYPMVLLHRGGYPDGS